MANTKEFKEKRKACEEMFRSGVTDPERLAIVFGVAKRTVLKWINEGGWQREEDEIVNLEKEVNKNMTKALNVGLKQFINDPANSSLQSLVALLKDFQKRTQPIKELNTYIIKFLEQTVDFFISTEQHDLKVKFQENLVELAEYLRTKNNG